MQAMHAGSTDARLDAIDAKVGSLGGEMRELRYEMKAGFERVDDHFERMHRLMVQGVIGLSAAYLAGFAALIGLISTQL